MPEKGNAFQEMSLFCLSLRAGLCLNIPRKYLQPREVNRKQKLRVGVRVDGGGAMEIRGLSGEKTQ